MRWRLCIPVLVACLAMGATSAAAAPDPAPYRAHGYGGTPGFHDILPPGENGLDNAVQLAAFEALKAHPEHNNDQLGMYAGLLRASPGLTGDGLLHYFKDSSFGVPSGDVERVERPRSDVKIVRDKGFGVPHIYGQTRAALEFGIGYASAEDRLFLMDVLRHAGRGETSSFAGGTKGNRVMDQQQWQSAPYTEADLRAQLHPSDAQITRIYGAAAAPHIEGEYEQLRSDAQNYIDGINAYIDAARLNPLLMPAEYLAIGQPLGPTPWKLTDLVASASLIGGIFGHGGGAELTDAESLEAFQHRYGRRRGHRRYMDFVDPDDPEAPTTVHHRHFPYETPPRHPRGVALPDRGSVQPADTVTGATGAASGDSAPASGSVTIRSHRHRSALGGLLDFPGAMSNALLVSARRSQSGHPIAVMGPQVSYFSPQILMEEDIHAPGGDGTPSIDARGAAFPGVSLYVELGHGSDYAWSATSAGQDIIDTYAVDLCEPDGSKPTIHSNSYLFHGACLPMDKLVRTNSWQPSLADSTPAGTETLTTYRTKMGLVIGRATRHGRPVAYTSLRSTYNHEIDSALGFSELNSPDYVHDPRSFKLAVSHINYTFNWFYADDRHIAYFNSGANPRRPAHQNPFYPVLARKRFEWRDWDADTNSARYEPNATHPQNVDQRFLTSWNNKQAPGQVDDGINDGPIYRSQSLDQGIHNFLRGGHKMTLTQLGQAMESAATVDLRWRALRYALKIIGNPSAVHDPGVSGALTLLHSWIVAGAHRRDLNGDGNYEHATAIRIADAWWPRLVAAVFEPRLGQALYQQAIVGQVGIDNAPNNDGAHLGSAYQDGAYSIVQRALRQVLARHDRRHGRHRRRHAPARPFHARYCANARRASCRRALVRSLAAAVAHDSPHDLYADPTCADAGRNFDQTCFDAISFRALGAVTQPLLAWQNRPTYQQAVEIQGHRPR